MATSEFSHFTSSCPEAAVLRLAADGKLGDEQLDTLSEHLKSCQTCLAVIDRLIVSDNPNDMIVDVPAFKPNRARSVHDPIEARPELGNRFQVIGKLGSGGMGEVFKCFDKKLARHVAVKKIRPAMFDPELMNRLEAEARIQSSLNHPGIVQIYEVGQWAGIPFFVMEFVPGRSLKQELNRSPLSPRLAASIVMQVARALDYAHQNRVIHRDLKPSNILLTDEFSEASRQPSSMELQRLACRQLTKIADFGLAKILDDSGRTTRSDVIVGTPAYLSPEQVSTEKKPVMASADIYALGVVLYESLTGHPPFESHALNITLAMIETMAPVSPRAVSPGISKDLETICLKCLEKEPANRYESALALADDLERYLGGRPILARPISRLQKCWRWCGRNRSTAAAISLAVFSLCTLTAGSLYYASREAELLQAALTEAEKSSKAETLARQAESAARQAAIEARKESDLARNNLFTGLYHLNGIKKQLDALANAQPSREAIRAINLESKKTIDSILQIYVNRPTMKDDPKGDQIDRLFLDGIALRDFGAHDQARAIFDRLIALARDCPAWHQDSLRRFAAACRSVTVSALMLMDSPSGDHAKAFHMVDEAWHSWPIAPDTPSVTSSMLDDRMMLGQVYARLLREKGRATEAGIVEEQVRRIAAERLRLFARKAQAPRVNSSSPP